ncbi:MAG: mercuric reductase [Piscirickettsiaceae bacterium]|nr:mercuric reductase [Piscirickettsiaceae bacterium]
MAQKTDYDLCIIGGGAAGLVTAAGAASLGAKVVLIEKHRLGGDCLYTGCVPSKTVIHSAKVAHTIKESHRFGISAQLDVVDQSKVMQRVSEVIKTIEPNDSPERFRAMGIEVIFAEAQFISDDRLRVDGREITARKFVIATGTRPFIPSINGLDSVDYCTNETIFNIKENIEHLIVIGAGAIGCEMAQSFVRLGSKVSLVGRSELLAHEDTDMSEVVKQQFITDDIKLYLSSSLTQVEKIDNGLRITLTEGNNDSVIQIEGSHLLIATGRQANIDNLGLDKAGVAIENNRLVVDARLRTTNKRIYACGDVAGPYLFTHMAEHQAGVVLRNTLFHLPAKSQTKGIPWCTFTDPELARVGLSEREAQQQGIKHRVYTFAFEELDRAIIAGETQGKVKIITAPNGKLLGACIVGAHAGELIAEYVLAISQGLNVSALSNTIHIYPTLAQINRRVADQRRKEALTPNRKRWIKRLFGLRGKHD